MIASLLLDFVLLLFRSCLLFGAVYLALLHQPRLEKYMRDALVKLREAERRGVPLEEHPVCQDGSLDMRFAANRGLDKHTATYNQASFGTQHGPNDSAERVWLYILGHSYVVLAALILYALLFSRNRRQSRWICQTRRCQRHQLCW